VKRKFPYGNFGQFLFGGLAAGVVSVVVEYDTTTYCG
jgi:hypothetical protein